MWFETNDPEKHVLSKKADIINKLAEEKNIVKRVWTIYQEKTILKINFI